MVPSGVKSLEAILPDNLSYTLSVGQIIFIYFEPPVIGGSCRTFGRTTPRLPAEKLLAAVISLGLLPYLEQFVLGIEVALVPSRKAGETLRLPQSMPSFCILAETHCFVRTYGFRSAVTFGCHERNPDRSVCFILDVPVDMRLMVRRQTAVQECRR